MYYEFDMLFIFRRHRGGLEPASKAEKCLMDLSRQARILESTKKPLRSVER